jgi:hypothetical protein
MERTIRASEPLQPMLQAVARRYLLPSRLGQDGNGEGGGSGGALIAARSDLAGSGLIQLHSTGGRRSTVPYVTTVAGFLAMDAIGAYGDR